MATDFGKRVQRARERAGLTQTQLAKAVGLSQSTIANAESVATGSRKTLQIAARCKVNAHWLATGEDEENWCNPEAAPPSLQAQEAVAETLQRLATHLANSDDLTRQAVEPFVRRLVLHPSEAYEISNRVQMLIAAEPRRPEPVAKATQPRAASSTSIPNPRSQPTVEAAPAFDEIALVTNSRKRAITSVGTADEQKSKSAGKIPAGTRGH